ncbi:MAG: hypothetical protein GY953_52085, partial [bacterium]|nr:hypothetical protein [bacterium]
RGHHPCASIHSIRQHRSDGGHYWAYAIIKNVGIRIASGTFVFFNNAEICQAGQSLALIEQRMLASPDPLCLRGRVIDRPRHLLDDKNQAELEALHDATDHRHERVASADHAGLAAVPRHLLISVGGFDERFDHWGKEDLDLAARLKRAGATYSYDEELKSFHVHHSLNFERRGDYRRMAKLLDENTANRLVEANVGRLWGQLRSSPSEELEASILMEGDSDVGALGKRLEKLLFGARGEAIEVVVAAQDPFRPAIEALLERRFKQVTFMSLPDIAESGSLGRVVRCLRAGAICLIPSASPAWSWRELEAQAGRAGPPWILNRDTALKALAECGSFGDLELATRV